MNNMNNIFNIPRGLLDAVNKVLLTEHELTRREVAQVDNSYADEIVEHRKATAKISGHVFGTADRITVPLDHSDSHVKTAVTQHLHSIGHTGVDFASGTSVDKHGRTTSIGRTLAKTDAPKSLIDSYATHQQSHADEEELHKKDLQVVISRHPHDVIGMSQGTDWGLRDGEHPIDTKAAGKESCMAFGTYQHGAHMRHELKAGTHVAWLTHKGDDEAKEPLARITLRPYTTVDQNPSELKYKSYKFDVPKKSQLYHNSKFEAVDGDVSNSVDTNLDMATSDNDAIPHHESFFGSETKEHHSGTKLVTTVHFNKPMSTSAIRDFHHGLSDEIGHYELHNFDGIDPEPHQASTAGPAHEILVPGKKHYGRTSYKFRQTVEKWADTHFKPKSGEPYTSKPGVYLDNDPSSITK